MTIIWKYLYTGEVKHMMKDSITRDSECGVSTAWYIYYDAWQSDETGLDSRRECKLCPSRRKNRLDKEMAAKKSQS